MSPFMFLFFLFSLALAAPFHGRSVFDPPITSPTAESVWKVGDVETVTWDATGIPAGVTGRIMLGFLSSTSEGEHLSVTLASGFNLTDAKVDVTVPPVVSGTEYIIVLFGDSGNISPEFTIQGLSTSPSSATSSAIKATSNKATSTKATTSPSTQLDISTLPTPPIATRSSTASLSTSTAPSSAPGTSSPSLPTSSSPASSPSPSPSTGAGWSMKNLKTYQLIMAPAALLLLL